MDRKYTALKDYIKENELLIIHIIQELEHERASRKIEEKEPRIPVIYGYARVSTQKQIDNNSLEEQDQRIKEFYPNAEVFAEAQSGNKNSDVLLAIIEKMQSGDILVVTKVDRLCRNVLLGTLYFQLIINKGCKLHVLNLGLLDDSPYSRMSFINLLNIAEFERKMTLEKMMGGKKIAKTKEGYKEGRPKEFTTEELDRAFRMLSVGTYKEVSTMTGISVSTLVRYRREKIKKINNEMEEQLKKFANIQDSEDDEIIDNDF